MGLDGFRQLLTRRRAWPAYLLVITVSALPMMALIGVFAFDAALEGKAAVHFSRDVASSNDEGRPLHLSRAQILDDGSEVQVVLLAPGEVDLGWPDLGKVPEVGTVYLSEPLLGRVAALVDVVPQIGEASVVRPLPVSLVAEPGELVALASVNRADMPHQARPAGIWDSG